MVRHAKRHWIAVVVLCGMVGACMTLGVKSKHVDRGLIFNHKTHPAKDLGCTDCHATDTGEPVMPNHDICSACHEEQIATKKDAPQEEKVKEDACGHCHTKPEQKIVPRTKALSDEAKFSHKPHLAKEVACDVCHPAPSTSVLPQGAIMSFCMDCHAKTRPELTECKVCHAELTKDVRPKYRGKSRIAHDAPQIWETIHGQESKVDPAYCDICHDREASCEDCHRKNPPKSHTVSWRRKSHGLRAEWDREKCAACHEEDSCIKCHKHTEPSSHRGAWGRPLYRHCITCHYPPDRTNCTVCHESIEHPTALPSPHVIGIYPSRCAPCHPGNNPYRAPHVINSTTRCTTCH